VINSNLSLIFHLFRDMVSFPLNFLPPNSTRNLKTFLLHYIAEILHA